MIHFEIFSSSNVNLIIFFSSLKNDTENLPGNIEAVLEKYHRPDKIVLIFPDCDRDTYNLKLLKSKEFINNLNRYGPSVNIEAFSFNKLGKLLPIDDLNENSEIELINIRNNIVKHGLSYLAEKNCVIEKSPPGSAFIKPSQDKKTEFIATHRLAQTDTECCFVAFCIISKFKNILDYQKIYIDTSAISHIILSVINLLNRLNDNTDYFPTFESYHSYSGLDCITPKFGQKFLVIISASSSNNMASKIEKLWAGKVNSNEILTLLSFKIAENVLCHLSSKSSSQTTTVERFVKRVDEYFTIEHSKPKTILIKKIHGKEISKWPFKSLYNSHSHSCNKPKKPELVESEVSLNLMKLSDDVLENIDEWWSELIDWHIPITTRYIITDKTDPFTTKYIKQIENKISVKVIDFNEIIDFSFDNTKKAALILLPALGSGDQFISANRDLRLAGHDGIRIFVTFFHLYRSKSSLEIFKKSLLFGPEFAKYKFFTKFSLNVPSRIEKSSWELEKSLYEKEALYQDSDELQRRYEQLSSVQNGLLGKVGFNGRDFKKNLSFTRHFAFWDFEYNSKDVAPEAVYFTVSSVLQSARDDFENDFENSLESSPHQQALLSPENFARFNDPLLQSCLWRAAKSSELDYSSDENLSDDFVSILERLSRAIDKERGEAFSDLLLGIALRKITLSVKALKRLEKIIEKISHDKMSKEIQAILKIFKIECTHS